jgi:hypothetical protein
MHSRRLRVLTAACVVSLALSACESGSLVPGPPAEPEQPGDASTEPDDAGNDEGASDTAGAWRPFSDDSPWNTPVAGNAAVDPDSDAMIADLAQASHFEKNLLTVNIENFSIPLFNADAGTPTTTVTCDIGGEGFESDDGFDAAAEIPIPEGAAPDPSSDAHMLIIDRENNVEWGLWQTQNDGGDWTCGLGASADLGGDGLRPYKPDNPTWYTSHGARACGFPLSAGLIRIDEVEAGSIDHALVVAYPHIRPGFYTSPASTAQAAQDDTNPNGIPCGGRIQLDPDLDLDSLGLSETGRMIAEALQTYGAYVGDYSGATNLYADGSPEAQAFWGDGVLATNELAGLELSDFRVLELGELTDDGDG